MFHRVLERLTEAVESGTRGVNAQRCTVDRCDLGELLHHFHRLDQEIRDHRAKVFPEPRKDKLMDSLINGIKLRFYLTGLCVSTFFKERFGG